MHILIHFHIYNNEWYNAGMIKWIIICVIGLIILGNLGIDVKKAIDSKTAQSNLEYAKNITVFIWDKYLEQPVKFLWTNVFIKYIWIPATKYLNNRLEGSEMKLKKEALAPMSAFFDFSRVQVV